MDHTEASQGSLFGEPAPERKRVSGPSEESAPEPTPDPVEKSATEPSPASEPEPQPAPLPKPAPAGHAGDTVAFGGNRLVGQGEAKEHLGRILSSGRLSHAYLFTGPRGSGKTAFALALAEWVNGIANLSEPVGGARSGKSSWHAHPDIHVFFPMPSGTSETDRLTRLEWLAQDPYELIDYANRPAISPLPEPSGAKGARSGGGSGRRGGSAVGAAKAGSKSGGAPKTLKAFYSIQTFRELIRPVTVLSPNEGTRTVVVMTGIETMRAETANAFLKLLEEPAGEVMFVLTADSVDSMLPTILSRCQLIRLRPLRPEEIAGALTERDGMSDEDARFVARMAGGNYALARFFDPDGMRARLDQLIEFLRKSYSLDAGTLVPLVEEWSSKLNVEGQVALLSQLELLLRDILLHRETGGDRLVVHAERMEVISGFQARLGQARLEEMIDEVGRLKPLLLQNVQFRLSMIVLAARFHSLMKGEPTRIPSHSPWGHLPALES